MLSIRLYGPSRCLIHVVLILFAINFLREKIPIRSFSLSAFLKDPEID